MEVLKTDREFRKPTRLAEVRARKNRFNRIIAMLNLLITNKESQTSEVEVANISGNINGEITEGLEN